jgi:hypothetical protein
MKDRRVRERRHFMDGDEYMRLLAEYKSMVGRRGIWHI